MTRPTVVVTCSSRYGYGSTVRIAPGCFRAVRQAAGLTQVQMAAALDISRRSVIRYEQSGVEFYPNGWGSARSMPPASAAFRALACDNVLEHVGTSECVMCHGGRADTSDVTDGGPLAGTSGDSNQVAGT